MSNSDVSRVPAGSEKAAQDSSERVRHGASGGLKDLGLDAPREFVSVRQDRREVLKERASLLALEPAKKVATQGQLDILEFALGIERYAVESLWVREVYPATGLTAVPCTPSFVLGILNVRGQIVSVIDLQKFFAMGETRIQDSSKIVILQDKNMELGLLADSVLGVTWVPVADLDLELPTLRDASEGFIKGVTGGRLVVLDAHRLLSDKRMIVHEEIGG